MTDYNLLLTQRFKPPGAVTEKGFWRYAKSTPVPDIARWTAIENTRKFFDAQYTATGDKPEQYNDAMRKLFELFNNEPV